MKNRVIIITGASSGIGKALAFALAKKGNKLVLAGRNKEKLNAVLQKMNEVNISAISIVTDVCKKEDCKNLINKCITEFGRIDVLINNAGISMRALFNESDLEIIDKVNIHELNNYLVKTYINTLPSYKFDF